MGKIIKLKYFVISFLALNIASMAALPNVILLPVFLPMILSGHSASGDHAIVFPDTENRNQVYQPRDRHQIVSDRLTDKNLPSVVPPQSYQLPTQNNQNHNIEIPKRQNGYENESQQTQRNLAQPNRNIQRVQNEQDRQPAHNIQNAQNFQNYRPNAHYVDPSLNMPMQFVAIVPESVDQRQHGFSGNLGQSAPPAYNQGSASYVPLKVQEMNEAGIHGSEGTIPVQPVNPSSASVTGFGLDIMKALETLNPGNTVVSPYSIALVLALLQQGTEGEAQVQISRALRMNAQQSRESFRQLVSAVRNRRSRNILNIATSIFYSDTFNVHQQYRNDAVQFFSSDLAAVNFNNPVFTSNLINEWVSTGTQGHIPYLVGPDTLTPETLMVLANAVFFKGLWNNTFNPERTVSRPFILRGGVKKDTSFMHNTGSFKAGRDARLNADFLVMPFEGLQYSLISVVPSERSDVGSLIRQLSHEDMLRFLASPVREVVISIPKFDIRVDTNLVDPLKALGIRNIFTENSGLSALGDARGGRPRVTGALHTAILSIDEQGGSAAATTLLAVSTLSIDFNDLEFRFHADRPFVCVLWDNELSVPLFIAKIDDPVVAKKH